MGFTLRGSKRGGRPRATAGEPSPSRWRERRVDIAVYALILGVGALEIALHRRSDFYFDDYGYVERGLSLLRHHTHGFNGTPELVQPPGLPILIAAIAAVFGSSYPVLLSAMAVFCTAGLLVTYELLRREENRGVAATVCLLLASSGDFFYFATRAIYPCYPFMLAAVAALLAARTADAAPAGRSRAGWAAVTGPPRRRGADDRVPGDGPPPRPSRMDGGIVRPRSRARRVASQDVSPGVRSRRRRPGLVDAPRAGDIRLAPAGVPRPPTSRSSASRSATSPSWARRRRPATGSREWAATCRTARTA